MKRSLCRRGVVLKQHAGATDASATMRFRRIFTPSRLLFTCASFFGFLLGFMIIDSLNECSTEELTATKKLLQKYSDQLQEMKNDQMILRGKLKEAESQIVASSSSKSTSWIPGLPVIYLITPTYFRTEQKAELTRLSQTLMLVKNIHWIVIEDSGAKTDLVTRFLKQTGLSYTHLNALTPTVFKMASTDPNWLKPRGVNQRNAGLEWLRKNTNPQKQPGVVYFADDDNTYSLKLFDEMRFTKKVSVWPVGLVGYLRYETPLIENGKVARWFTYWKPKRPFAMDMAGFAVNLQVLHDYPEAKFSNNVNRGLQESTILQALQISLDDLEPKANMCTEVLVWHTRTEKTRLTNEDKMVKKYGFGTDPKIEV